MNCVVAVIGSWMTITGALPRVAIARMTTPNVGEQSWKIHLVEVGIAGRKSPTGLRATGTSAIHRFVVPADPRAGLTRLRRLIR